MRLGSSKKNGVEVKVIVRQEKEVKKNGRATACRVENIGAGGRGQRSDGFGGSGGDRSADQSAEHLSGGESLPLGGGFERGELPARQEHGHFDHLRIQRNHVAVHPNGGGNKSEDR